MFVFVGLVLVLLLVAKLLVVGVVLIDWIVIEFG